ncbi:MAG TPA: TlpA disulfide reductase family protein [Blastocatellia bacterium]|nr:TlpA disulfide reductase family protein [Blastocatellia bacterium]
MNRMIASLTALTISFTATITIAIGQVVTTEPTKPKWGETLKITYNPEAPGAKFTPDQVVKVRVYQSISGAGEPSEQTITLVKSENVLTAEVKVEPNVGNLQLGFSRPTGEFDPRAQKILPVYRTDGQPARGAHLALASANPKNYREEVANELALYPDNYGAYRTKWWLGSMVDQKNIKEVIQADINEVAPKIEGEPASWLYALTFGYLQLKEEAKSRAALRRLKEKYPDASQFERALADYWYQSVTQRLTGEGPAEVFGMIYDVMRRKPTSDFARQYIRNLAWNKETPLEVSELVCGKWMDKQPTDPSPHYILAIARSAHEQKPDLIAPAIEKALELYLREGSPRDSYFMDRDLPTAYRLSAEAAFKQQRYPQAVAAIKAAQTLNNDSSNEVLMLEARIWEKLSQQALAEKAYRAAWKLGSKEAEEGMRALYRKDKGNLNGFEAWLNKADKETAKSAAKPFPAFSVTSLEGKKYEFAALRGKVVVINFWYIGCGPCKAEMPELNRLVKDYAGKEVVFLALTFDDAENLRAFLKQTPFTYEIIPDSQGLVDQLSLTAFPAHYVLNQRGESELMLYGSGEKNVEQIRNVVARLIAAK